MKKSHDLHVIVVRSKTESGTAQQSHRIDVIVGLNQLFNRISDDVIMESHAVIEDWRENDAKTSWLNQSPQSNGMNMRLTMPPSNHATICVIASTLTLTLSLTLTLTLTHQKERQTDEKRRRGTRQQVKEGGQYRLENHQVQQNHN